MVDPDSSGDRGEVFLGCEARVVGFVKQECLKKISKTVLLRLFKGAFFGVILELNVYFSIKGVS